MPFIRLISTIVLATVAAVTSGGLGPAASAADGARPVLVELFTSQGCSSCPPADKLFESYAGRRDLVAVSLPVDYWDYLGWKDTLASHKFSKRQRDYAARHPGGQVFTPQIVVNGRTAVVGSEKDRVDAAIASAVREAQVGPALRATIDRNTLIVDVGAGKLPEGPNATVWLAVIQRRVEVKIGQGENAGRKVSYFNVVRELMPVGKWTGEAINLRLDRASVMSTEGEACAVFLQAGKGGPILAAVWFD